LSERETEVVRALAQGRTNQEIAAELFISLSTVKSHLAGVQSELALRNRVEIVTWAWENHIMPTVSARLTQPMSCHTVATDRLLFDKGASWDFLIASSGLCSSRSRRPRCGRR
jgi:DNA-binding CsgD family transcriptional regulator